MNNEKLEAGLASDLNRELEATRGCSRCLDADGDCVYPYYGVAPHNSFTEDGKPLKSEILAKKEWPENFLEDDDAHGCGVYTHCLSCGASRE